MYGYGDREWRQYYEEWAGLVGDKHCQCDSNMLSSRWYAFDTEFPCRDHVQLCSESANRSSSAFALAALSQNAVCFPEPVPDMLGAGSYMLAIGNKINTLQNMNFTKATRAMVEMAGSKFCNLLKVTPVVMAPALFSALVPSHALHMNAVIALSRSLDVLTTTALSMVMTANTTDAESAYIRQYLNWHSSRVIGQAYSEVQVGNNRPWAGNMPFSGKPLLLPLGVQTAFNSACMKTEVCNFTRFVDNEYYSVWHFDMFNFATYTCQPKQCLTVIDGTWLNMVAKVVALFGSLMNAIIFVALPIVWAMLCWYGFTSSTAGGSAGALTAPPSGLQVAPAPQEAGASSGNLLQVLGPCSMSA